MGNKQCIYLSAVLVAVTVILSLTLQEDKAVKLLHKRPWKIGTNISNFDRDNAPRSPLPSNGGFRYETTSPCTPQESIVYIKTHKTGSTTVQTVLYRYGLSRNFSFVLRRTNPINGHIRYLHVTEDSPKEMFLPLLGEGECLFRGYNMSAVHVVHNKRVFETFMNPGTKYITILRNPVSQFLSAFVFFDLGKNMEGNSNETKLLNYLKCKEWKRSPYSKNSQSKDLGLKTTDFDNQTKINAFIRRLDDEIDLVLIHEYFDESIVLLVRELCWKLEDAIFTILNNRSLTKPTPSPEILNKLSTFNRADFLLYEHFNKTFWKRIEGHGHGFWEDLKVFRQLQSELADRCLKTSSLSKGQDPGKDGDAYCDNFIQEASFLFNHVFKRQNRTC